MEILDKHAPKKIKIFWEDYKSQINETLRKAIVKRSQFENKTNKTKDPNILKYRKQRNYVVKLKNQSEQELFDCLNTFVDSKPFWKSWKPYFFNKHSFSNSKFAFGKSGEVLHQNIKILKTFNLFSKMLVLLKSSKN